jgi:hypothetical protein
MYVWVRTDHCPQKMINPFGTFLVKTPKDFKFFHQNYNFRNPLNFLNFLENFRKSIFYHSQYLCAIYVLTLIYCKKQIQKVWKLPKLWQKNNFQPPFCTSDLEPNSKNFFQQYGPFLNLNIARHFESDVK